MKYNNLELRKCTLQDVVQIYDLQNIIIDELVDKDILRKNTRDMFEICTKVPNMTLGVFEEKMLIALAIIVDARGTNEDLSENLVSCSVSIPANLKLVLVRKEYRGNGLQKALMLILEKYAYLQGYTHFCTTVSANNIYSLNNIIESKYIFDHDVIKYGGLKRKLFVKDIYGSIKEYNKMIMKCIGSWEGRHEPNELIIEGINFDKCFQSDISVATTGDVLEYEDNSSGEVYFGLFVKSFISKVVIYIPSRRCIGLVDFSSHIESMQLRNVWVNSIGGT